MRFTVANWGKFLCVALPVLVFGAQAMAGPEAQCSALEHRLRAIDGASSATYGPRADTRRHDHAIARQQNAYDKTLAHARRIGCGAGAPLFFQRADAAQCRSLAGTMNAMRANLAKLRSQRDAIARQGRHGASNERARLASTMSRLGCDQNNARQNNGRQDRTGDALPARAPTPAPAPAPAPAQERKNFHIQEIGQPPRGSYRTSSFGGRRALGTRPSYRTMCVRSCDGFFFPVSFATLPTRFSQDAEQCQQLCPTADVGLYVHQNPGGQSGQMMSLAGQPYGDLANAWRFKKEYVKGCTCNQVNLQLEADGASAPSASRRGFVSLSDSGAPASATH